MKKIIMISILASSLFGNKILCEINTERMDGIFDVINYSIKNKKWATTAKYAKKMDKHIFEMISNCGADDPKTKVYMNVIKDLEKAGMLDGK